MFGKHYLVMMPFLMLTLLSCAVYQVAPTPITIQQTRPTIKSDISPTFASIVAHTPATPSETTVPTVTPNAPSVTTTPSSRKWIAQPQLTGSTSEFLHTSRIAKVVAASSGYVFFLPYESNNGTLVTFDIGNSNIITDTFIGRRNQPTMPYDIFLGRDGTVWALGNNDREANSIWMLRRFDSQKKQFVPIQDSQGLLRGDGKAGLEQMCEDLHGNLWLMIGERIIKYTPVTGQAKQAVLPEGEYKQLGLEAGLGSVYCDGKDNIWFTVGYQPVSKTNESSWKLFRLGSDRLHLTDFTNAGQNVSGYSFIRIAIDQAGIMWIVDTSVGLVKVDTRNPAAHWEVIRPGSDTFTPESLISGRDGKLWITTQGGTDAGITVYDPTTGILERASDVWSAVGQSDDGAIWAADAKQVYKIMPGSR